jgi:hypothetical protein
MNAQGTKARTLVESLRRGAWRITPSPNTASLLNELYGYSCNWAGSCLGRLSMVDGTTLAQEALIETTAGLRSRCVMDPTSLTGASLGSDAVPDPAGTARLPGPADAGRLAKRRQDERLAAGEEAVVILRSLTP